MNGRGVPRKGGIAVKFYKFNGAGNDFIIINNLQEHIAPEYFPLLARTLCERHLSIGADGLMLVAPSDRADFRMEFYNSDGTAGEMCGNGARCICRYGYEMGLSGETQTVETASGIVTGQRIDRRNYRIRLTDPSVIKPAFTIELDGDELECGYVELGDPGLPHAVVHIPGLASADRNALFDLGRRIRWHSAFPKGANVNFYDFDGENSVCELTFERGVEDFTYACGTGTGSVAVVLACRGLISGRGFTAHVRGGTLTVDILRDGERISAVYLTGPTNMVASGEILDEELCLRPDTE